MRARRRRRSEPPPAGSLLPASAMDGGVAPSGYSVGSPAVVGNHSRPQEAREGAQGGGVMARVISRRLTYGVITGLPDKRTLTGPGPFHVKLYWHTIPLRRRDRIAGALLALYALVAALRPASGRRQHDDRP